MKTDTLHVLELCIILYILELCIFEVDNAAAWLHTQRVPARLLSPAAR